jgi:hypothetical protein
MEEEYIYDEYCYNPGIISNGYISSSNTTQSSSNETTKKTNEPQKSILSS